MINLLPNLEIFLQEIRSQTEFIDSISEIDGTIIIKLKYWVFNNFDKAHSFLAVINPLMKQLRLDNYIKRVETGLYKVGILTAYSGVEYHVNLTALHADRLRGFFHKDMTQTDAANSVDYLQKLGWGEKQFIEVGLSHASFHRYRLKRTEKEPVTKDDTHTLEINNSIEAVAQNSTQSN